MTREIRSRRAGLSRDEARRQPIYARLLGLQYLTPSGFLCFVFLEGAVALGVLLALAELVSWWGVLVLPLTVAAMVKLNDVVAGAVSRPAAPATAGPGVRVDTYWAAGTVTEPSWDSFDGDASDTCVLPVVPELPAIPSPAGRRAWLRPAAMNARPSAAPMPSAPAAAGWTASATAAVRTRSSPNSTDAVALNGPPAARQWGSPADEHDTPQQWSRQAASHHYD